MKKFSSLATFFVLAASFATPILASAQFDYACNPRCAANEFCDSNLRCVSNSVLTQQSTGGINLGVIRPYSDGIINLINGILVPVLFAIAFIVFLWGVFKYFIWGGENESEKAEGRKFAMWGVIGFVVILSLWGLVNLAMSTLGFSTSTLAPRPPTI